MIGLEHFKTCVRAYFPEHDFAWLAKYNITYVSCTGLVCYGSPDEYESDDEKVLLSVLRKFSRLPSADPGSFEFSFELVLICMRDDLVPDIVLALKNVRISADERRKPKFGNTER